jgi:hypothetical protein
VLPPFPFILERGKRNMGWIEMVLKSDLIEMKETLAIQIPWPIILQKKKDTMANLFTIHLVP